MAANHLHCLSIECEIMVLAIHLVNALWILTVSRLSLVSLKLALNITVVILDILIKQHFIILYFCRHLFYKSYFLAHAIFAVPPCQSLPAVLCIPIIRQTFQKHPHSSYKAYLGLARSSYHVNVDQAQSAAHQFPPVINNGCKVCSVDNVVGTCVTLFATLSGILHASGWLQ